MIRIHELSFFFYIFHSIFFGININFVFLFRSFLCFYSLCSPLLVGLCILVCCYFFVVAVVFLFVFFFKLNLSLALCSSIIRPQPLVFFSLKSARVAQKNIGFFCKEPQKTFKAGSVMRQQRNGSETLLPHVFVISLLFSGPMLQLRVSSLPCWNSYALTQSHSEEPHGGFSLPRIVFRVFVSKVKEKRRAFK